MMVPIAQRQAKKHGGKLYASVCIAQAIHESGWGTSTKMIKANALFGIKVGKSAYKFGTAWKGAAYKTGTTEYYDGKTATKITDWFRAYNSVEDATEDYMDLLCTAKRYKAALNRATPRQSIEAIKNGRYATGPEYVTHIMSYINTLGLTKYDNWNTAFTPITDHSTVKKGSRGENVKELQTLLKNKGYDPGTIDGIFGNKTRDAVMRFQNDHNLKVDGIVGIVTWNALSK